MCPCWPWSDVALLGKSTKESADNQRVFKEAAEPLLDSALKEGGRSTLMFFGQTGTGKTYTARGVLDIITQQIFSDPGMWPRCKRCCVFC